MRILLKTIAISLLLSPMMAVSAGAQSGGIPRCTAEVAGSLSCQANVACRCQYYHASAAHGTPAGYRWDCGIKRPKCEVTPADAGYQGPFPEAVAIDRSADIVSQSQTQESTQSSSATSGP